MEGKLICIYNFRGLEVDYHQFIIQTYSIPFDSNRPFIVKIVFFLLKTSVKKYKFMIEFPFNTEHLIEIFLLDLFVSSYLLFQI